MPPAGTGSASDAVDKALGKVGEGVSFLIASFQAD